MPDAGPQRQRATGGASQDAAARSAAAARQADHESIDRLTEELLPALIAKLGSTHLGELEVREGDWHVRLRRPYGTAPGEGAHADPRETAKRLRTAIIAELDRLAELPLDELVEARYRRYRALGPYTEVATPEVAPPPSRGIADRLRDLLDPTRWSMGMPLPGSSRRDEPPAHEEV